MLLKLPTGSKIEGHCGIYFLINRGVVTYIGKSKDWFARMMYHKVQLMPFDSARLIECSEDKLDYYESRWIKRFMPIYNHQLKGRKEYVKKKKYPKTIKKMHFRKLTFKSFIGFGNLKDHRVSDCIRRGKAIALTYIYFNLSHITFMDDVLEALKITPEWQINKPGVDKERGREFRETVYPDIMAQREASYAKMKRDKSIEKLRFINSATNDKQWLKNRNQRG
jgi:hypothetical protein